jgi:flavin-dependent dehydrogenase
MNSSNVSDVVIIGGGPAGSTAAAFLAMQGHQVTVLEKEKFPREHVGESLLPFCYDIFEQLGVLDEMELRYIRKPGVRFVDADGIRHTTWCFSNVIDDPSYLSFHVLRADFDQVLLENARKHGAQVFEQTKVKSVDLDSSDGIVNITAMGIDGEELTHQARFLLDASGRDTFLATRKGWKKPHKNLQRAALFAPWVGGEYQAGLADGLLQIVYLGGDKKGWIWVIPLGTDWLSIGVALDNAYIRRQKTKLLKQGNQDWQLALYLQELKSAAFVKDILKDARIARPLLFEGDYSYTVDRKFGDNFALIGDAATFIDPIFASGVFLSMKSARLVSNAVHRKLTSNNGSSGADFEEVYRFINGAYTLVDKAVQLFYNPAAINFAQVDSANQIIHQRHENALALGHYLLAGDFFENHAKYTEVIDLLQDPKLFSKYKKLVIDPRKNLKRSCEVNDAEIFGAGLHEHEERWKAMWHHETS